MEYKIIKTEKKSYKGKTRKRSGYTYTHIIKCVGLDCNNNCRVQKHHLKKFKGLCKRCSQKGKPYEAKYNELKKSCRRREIKITISYKEFLIFTKQNKCHYCLTPIIWHPFTKDTKNNQVVSRSYNLDRKDNNLGYLKQNCVVCCFKCNQAKSNKYTYEEWYGMTKYFRGKKI